MSISKIIEILPKLNKLKKLTFNPYIQLSKEDTLNFYSVVAKLPNLETFELKDYYKNSYDEIPILNKEELSSLEPQELTGSFDTVLITRILTKDIINE